LLVKNQPIMARKTTMTTYATGELNRERSSRLQIVAILGKAKSVMGAEVMLS
jgi:hypothetical protein